MRLRYKFIGIYTLIFTSVVSVVVLSLGTLSRLEKISASVNLGDTLLSQSRRVRTITKDVMIGAFAPDTYANLKDDCGLFGTRVFWERICISVSKGPAIAN